jgi:peptidoglycan/xylan/chitin deacetylase (PgdA/CDA1 family)
LRKKEKAIPSKSAVITIDDEWNSQYYVAWPILKEFGYPFTLFIYTQWVNTGGKAMTWAQLEEMRDAGVDIEAHTVSHHDLRHAPRGQDYTAWLHNEVYGCKETLESGCKETLESKLMYSKRHWTLGRPMALSPAWKPASSLQLRC